MQPFAVNVTTTHLTRVTRVQIGCVQISTGRAVTAMSLGVHLNPRKTESGRVGNGSSLGDGSGSSL